MKDSNEYADTSEGMETAMSEILWKVTRETAEGLAGRKITDEEAARIARAIEYSTVHECVSEAVYQVCGLTEDQESNQI